MTVGLLYTGNSLEILKSLPEKSVHCVVTSPPYFGLRSYSICSCRQGRIQHASPTLVGSQAGTPRHFSGPDPDCGKCLGTGHISGTSHVWGGDGRCEHQWLQETRKIQSGGTGTASAKQTSNLGTQGAVQEPVETGYCLFCAAWLGSLGNEPTPELFIEHLVLIFEEVKRVLRDDGTLWVVIADSFSDKSLCMVPAMLAIALRDDRWYLRADCHWLKPNTMPSSQRDRPTTDYEHVFLLSKSAKYFYDGEAVKEPATTKSKRAGKNSRANVDRDIRLLTKQDRINSGSYQTYNDRNKDVPPDTTRTLRTTWSIPTQATSFKHFAIYPERLVEIPISAGTSEYGCCASCGTPYERIVEKVQLHMSGSGQSGNPPSGKNGPDMQGGGETGDIRNGPVTITKTVGWEKMCGCLYLMCSSCHMVVDYKYYADVEKSIRRHGGGLPSMQSPTHDKKGRATLLQQEMRVNLDSKTPQHDKGMGEDIKRIYRTPLAESSECNAEWLHNGTSGCNGDEVGEILDEVRGSASSQQQQSRQQTRESRINDKARTRQVTETTTEIHSIGLPILPTEYRNHGTCKACGGSIYETAPPIIPATILDCFSGAATTGLVALRRGLHFIGIEQNSDYNLLAEKRLLDAGLDCIVI